MFDARRCVDVQFDLRRHCAWRQQRGARVHPHERCDRTAKQAPGAVRGNHHHRYQRHHMQSAGATDIATATAITIATTASQPASATAFNTATEFAAYAGGRRIELTHAGVV